MTPAKRRPATPASQGSKSPARDSDVPTAATDGPVLDEVVIAPVPPAATKDGTQLLGPDGVPLTQEAPAGDASGDSANPTDTGQVDPENRTTTQPPGRARSRHPERVWPD